MFKVFLDPQQPATHLLNWPWLRSRIWVKGSGCRIYALGFRTAHSVTTPQKLHLDPNPNQPWVRLTMQIDLIFNIYKLSSWFVWCYGKAAYVRSALCGTHLVTLQPKMWWKVNLGDPPCGTRQFWNAKRPRINKTMHPIYLRKRLDPRSSQNSTYKTVKARFRPCRPGKSP